MCIQPTYKHIEGPQGFRFEKESNFTYKFRHFIEHRETGSWVVEYTERVVRVCAFVLFATYNKYELWYVSKDIINFARHLAMAMGVELGPRRNVCELMEFRRDLVKYILLLPNGWRNRTYRAMDCHPGPFDESADFVYYYPWKRRKIDEKGA